MRILVVEDNPAHMRVAVEIIESAGHEVLQETDFVHGKEALRSLPQVDGVITDLFIPDGVFGKNGVSKEADQPRGLGLVLVAKLCRIPCVICTAGYHHGSKYNWICNLSRDSSFDWLHLVDSLADPEDYEIESQEKDWKRALNTLVRLVETKK